MHLLGIRCDFQHFNATRMFDSMDMVCGVFVVVRGATKPSSSLVNDGRLSIFIHACFSLFVFFQIIEYVNAHNGAGDQFEGVTMQCTSL